MSKQPKKESRKKEKRGIITAADAPFFEALKRLVVSVRSREAMAVVDLGLTAEQKEWLLGQGVPQMFDRGPVRANINGWQTWGKPAYIQASPFDHTVWLDADCEVVGDVERLFEHRPMLVRMNNNWPQNANDWRLYQHFPVPMQLATNNLVNAGVLGFDKGEASIKLLDVWAGMCRVALQDYEIRKLLMFYDNGALNWAIEKTESAGLIVDEPGLNRINDKTFKPEGDDVVHHYVKWSWKGLPPVS